MAGGGAQDLVFLISCPQITLKQSNVLESVFPDTGSPFYVVTTHRKAESITGLNPESPPPGHILSATCKTPQAGRMGSTEKEITDGILDFRREKRPTPVSQRMMATIHG